MKSKKNTASAYQSLKHLLNLVRVGGYREDPLDYDLLKTIADEAGDSINSGYDGLFSYATFIRERGFNEDLIDLDLFKEIAKRAGRGTGKAYIVLRHLARLGAYNENNIDATKALFVKISEKAAEDKWTAFNDLTQMILDCEKISKYAIDIELLQLIAEKESKEGVGTIFRRMKSFYMVVKSFVVSDQLKMHIADKELLKIISRGRGVNVRKVLDSYHTLIGLHTPEITNGYIYDFTSSMELLANSGLGPKIPEFISQLAVQDKLGLTPKHEWNPKVAVMRFYDKHKLKEEESPDDQAMMMAEEAVEEENVRSKAEEVLVDAGIGWVNAERIVFSLWKKIYDYKDACKAVSDLARIVKGENLSKAVLSPDLLITIAENSTAPVQDFEALLEIARVAKEVNASSSLLKPDMLIRIASIEEGHINYLFTALARLIESGVINEGNIKKTEEFVTAIAKLSEEENQAYIFRNLGRMINIAQEKGRAEIVLNMELLTSLVIAVDGGLDYVFHTIEQLTEEGFINKGNFERITVLILAVVLSADGNWDGTFSALIDLVKKVRNEKLDKIVLRIEFLEGIVENTKDYAQDAYDAILEMARAGIVNKDNINNVKELFASLSEKIVKDPDACYEALIALIKAGVVNKDNIEKTGEFLILVHDQSEGTVQESYESISALAEEIGKNKTKNNILTLDTLTEIAGKAKDYVDVAFTCLDGLLRAGFVIDKENIEKVKSLLDIVDKTKEHSLDAYEALTALVDAGVVNEENLEEARELIIAIAENSDNSASNVFSALKELVEAVEGENLNKNALDLKFLKEIAIEAKEYTSDAYKALKEFFRSRIINKRNLNKIKSLFVALAQNEENSMNLLCFSLGELIREVRELGLNKNVVNIGLLTDAAEKELMVTVQETYSKIRKIVRNVKLKWLSEMILDVKFLREIIKKTGIYTPLALWTLYGLHKDGLINEDNKNEVKDLIIAIAVHSSKKAQSTYEALLIFSWAKQGQIDKRAVNFNLLKNIAEKAGPETEEAYADLLHIAENCLKISDETFDPELIEQILTTKTSADVPDALKALNTFYFNVRNLGVEDSLKVLIAKPKLLKIIFKDADGRFETKAGLYSKLITPNGTVIKKEYVYRFTNSMDSLNNAGFAEHIESFILLLTKNEHGDGTDHEWDPVNAAMRFYDEKRAEKDKSAAESGEAEEDDQAMMADEVKELLASFVETVEEFFREAVFNTIAEIAGSGLVTKDNIKEVRELLEEIVKSADTVEVLSLQKIRSLVERIGLKEIDPIAFDPELLKLIAQRAGTFTKNVYSPYIDITMICKRLSMDLFDADLMRSVLRKHEGLELKAAFYFLFEVYEMLEEINVESMLAREISNPALLDILLNGDGKYFGDVLIAYTRFISSYKAQINRDYIYRFHNAMTIMSNAGLGAEVPEFIDLLRLNELGLGTDHEWDPVNAVISLYQKDQSEGETQGADQAMMARLQGQMARLKQALIDLEIGDYTEVEVLFSHLTPYYNNHIMGIFDSLEKLITVLRRENSANMS